MIRNYFIVAWRNLRKNKVFSFINIIGLSAGIACCMLIALYLKDEVSFDRYQRDASSIYQLATVFIQQGEQHKMPNTPAPMVHTMQRDFPEIESSVRLLSLFAE